jgi:hypothetical protein
VDQIATTFWFLKSPIETKEAAPEAATTTTAEETVDIFS